MTNLTKPRKEILEDELLNYKVPCSCPKGGIWGEDSDQEHICEKCGGSEWVLPEDILEAFEHSLQKAVKETIKRGQGEFKYYLKLHKDDIARAKEEERERIIKLAEKAIPIPQKIDIQGKYLDFDLHDKIIKVWRETLKNLLTQKSKGKGKG